MRAKRHLGACVFDSALTSFTCVEEGKEGKERKEAQEREVYVLSSQSLIHSPTPTLQHPHMQTTAQPPLTIFTARTKGEIEQERINTIANAAGADIQSDL